MTPQRQSSPVGMALFGAFFMLIASVFLAMGTWTEYRAGYAQRNYRGATGRVEESHVTTSHGSKGGTSYVRHILYSYPAGEGSHEGSTIGVTSFQSSAGTYSGTQAWVAEHPAGSPIQVYYDPNSPSDSALELSLDGSSELLVLFPMIHWIAGFALFLAGIRIGQPLSRQLVAGAYFGWGVITLLLDVWAAVPAAAALVGHVIYFLLGLAVLALARRRQMKSSWSG